MFRVLLLVGVATLLLAYLVAPVAQRLRRAIRVGRRRRPLPRWAAILIVYVIGAAACWFVWTLIGPRWEGQAERLRVELPSYMELALSRAAAIERAVKAQAPPGGVSDVLAGASARAGGLLKRQVRETLGEVGSGLPYLKLLWLAPFLSFVLLQASPVFRRSALRILPTPHLQWRLDEFFTHVNAVIAGFFRAQSLAAVLVAVVVGTMLALLRVPYALTVGIAAGALEFVPVLGPLLVALAVAMLTGGVPLLVALVGLAALRFTMDYVVYPRFFGRRMHLPPLVVILALLLGARLGGIVGVALSVPLVGVVSVTYRHWRDHRAIERLVREHAAAIAAQAAEAATPGPRIDEEKSA